MNATEAGENQGGGGYNTAQLPSWARALCWNRNGHLPEGDMARAIRESIVSAKASGRPGLDVSVVCHEVRGLDLAAGSGRQPSISLLDLGCNDVTYAQVGAVCTLRELDFDTTLSLRVCFDPKDEAGSAGRRGSGNVEGEVRLPLRHLINHHNACLYYTWIALEMAGLHDSVASLGFEDDGVALDQAITQGAKLLSQPRACISICRSSDIGAIGKIKWAIDAPPETRTALWGPLLRSQQQHVVLSAALQLKCDKHAQETQAGQSECAATLQDPAKSLVLDLQDQVRSQAEDNERLRAELESVNSQLEVKEAQLMLMQQQSREQTQQQQSAGTVIAVAAESSQSLQSQLREQSRRITDLEARLAEAETREQKTNERLRVALAEADECRARSERYRSEASNTEQELDKINAEANDKIEAANGRIRTLRSRRDEVEQELNYLKTKVIPELTADKDTFEDETLGLQDELEALNEQKDALLRIVEDLHQTCKIAGLNAEGRRSIDNTLANIGVKTSQDLRLSLS